MKAQAKWTVLVLVLHFISPVGLAGSIDLGPKVWHPDLAFPRKGGRLVKTLC
jgi:hypothetical protein